MKKIVLLLIILQFQSLISFSQISVDKLNTGIEYFNNRQFEKAIEIFTTAINEYSNIIPIIYFYRAYSYSNIGQYRKANKDFKIFLKSEPQSAKSYYYLGVNYRQLNEEENAKKSLLKAIENNPKYARAYWQLGALYLDMEKNDEGLKAYNKAIIYDSTNVKYYYERANIYIYRLHDNKKAIRDLGEVLLLDDNYKNEIVFGQYINILVLELNRLKAGSVLANKFVKKYPNSPIGYYFRGYCNFFLHDTGCDDLKRAYRLGYDPANKIIKEVCK